MIGLKVLIFGSNTIISILFEDSVNTMPLRCIGAQTLTSARAAHQNRYFRENKPSLDSRERIVLNYTDYGTIIQHTNLMYANHDRRSLLSDSVFGLSANKRKQYINK